MLELPVVDVQCHLFDRDLENDADDALAKAAVRLGPEQSGAQSKAPLQGLGRFANAETPCTVSFR